MDLGSTVEAFFHDEVERAFRDEGLAPGVMVEHYVVQLLAGYAAQQIESDAAGAAHARGGRGAAARAAAAPARDRRHVAVRLGLLEREPGRRVVDVDYYIEMGGTAYGELARGGPGWTRDPLRRRVRRAGANFVRFVGALALISRRVATPTSDRDILRLYRSWQRTKSANAAARLAALGVVPPKGDGRLQ